MPRDGQDAAFDAVYDADGYQSADLLDITLRGGGMIYISDSPVIVGGQAYEADIREHPEFRFSDDDLADGARFPMSVQNADGLLGAVDEFGVSVLDGATVVYKRAVTVPGADDWQVDTIGYFIVRDLSVDELLVKFTLVADYADPSKQMSSETIFLEELTPVAAEVTGDTGDGGRGRPDLGNRSGGFRGTYFDYLRNELFDRDHRPILD